MNIRKTIKILSAIWSCNVIVFTVSVFAYNYYGSVGLWQAGAWEALAVTSALSKLILTVCIIASISDGGIYE